MSTKKGEVGFRIILRKQKLKFIGRKGRCLVEIDNNNNTCGHIVCTDSGTVNLLRILAKILSDTCNINAK